MTKSFSRKIDSYWFSGVEPLKFPAVDKNLSADIDKARLVLESHQSAIDFIEKTVQEEKPEPFS